MAKLLNNKDYFGYMINEKFKKAIKTIHKLMNENKIKWALIGSTNMQLQGMDINPRDLDIVVQLKDLEKMREIFSEYDASAVKELKPLTDEPGWEVKLDVGNVEVHILGERDTGEYVSKLLANKLTRIKIDDIEIPCFTLEAEAQTYAETNREYKARLIQEFLEHA